MSHFVLAHKLVRVIDQPKSAWHAKNILSAAQEKGITLRTVAKKMGISPSYLSDLTKGKRNWGYVLEHAFLAATKEAASER